MAQLDNSTIVQKVRLRRRILSLYPAPPTVLETHGGYGRIFERTWYRARGGVVIEKDERKAEHLSQQRPTWAVYQGDCEAALAAGLAKETAFDIIDLDPYGQPFNVLAALAIPGRVFPDRWSLVVNDGLRQKVALNGGWDVRSLQTAIGRHGSNLYPIYLQVARECVAEFADKIGFDLVGWTGYYTGKGNMMSHYWGIMQRRGAANVPRETPAEDLKDQPKPAESKKNPAKEMQIE